MNRGIGLLVAGALGVLASGAPVRLEPAAVYVRVNQIGFRPADLKHATAFAAAVLPEAFELLTEPGGIVVFTGRSRPLANGQWGGFDHFVDLDFSRLRSSGRFRVRFGGVTSEPFEVRPDVYDAVPDALLEFLRQQRCGFNPFLKRACHQLDGRTAYGPMPDGTSIDARGGWHDAADLLKYLITSSNTAAVLLVADQTRPGIFGDRVSAPGLADSNGVPDVLDEARWGLEWMLRLHPAPDQLFHQVADDRDHAGFRLPPEDTVDYGWGPGGPRVVYFATGRPQGLGQYQSRATGIANLAGRYAAAMALGARVWSQGGWDSGVLRAMPPRRD